MLMCFNSHALSAMPMRLTLLQPRAKDFLEFAQGLWLLWPIAWGEYDRIWLLRLGHKKDRDSLSPSLSQSLSWLPPLEPSYCVTWHLEPRYWQLQLKLQPRVSITTRCASEQASDGFRWNLVHPHRCWVELRHTLSAQCYWHAGPRAK